jgi:hypothetical protein
MGKLKINLWLAKFWVKLQNMLQKLTIETSRIPRLQGVSKRGDSKEARKIHTHIVQKSMTRIEII